MSGARARSAVRCGTISRTASPSRCSASASSSAYTSKNNTTSGSSEATCIAKTVVPGSDDTAPWSASNAATSSSRPPGRACSRVKITIGAMGDLSSTRSAPCGGVVRGRLEVFDRATRDLEIFLEAQQRDHLPFGLRERGQGRDRGVELRVGRGVDAKAHAHPPAVDAGAFDYALL